jgi:GH24 family phage-related lysozyme (muramidase)
MTDPVRALVFEAVRAAARQGVFDDPGNVRDLDELLTRFGVPEIEPEPAPGAVLHASAVCEALIQRFEGFARVRPDGRVEAYPDPGSGGAPWTIGWGSTGADIRKGTVWTRAQCEERFRAHLEHFAEGVWAAIGTAPTSQGQFDAMVSFAYNCGTAAMARSTLLRLHKAGDFAGAAGEFAKWNKSAGKVLRGLTRRRAAEAALYKGE